MLAAEGSSPWAGAELSGEAPVILIGWSSAVPMTSQARVPHPAIVAHSAASSSASPSAVTLPASRTSH